MVEIDEIEQAAALAEAETGARGAGAKIRLCMAPSSKERSRRWSEKEDIYVRENHGRLSETAMAAYLGRSLQSVHIHITRELHLCAPSKDPRILTAEHVAMGLGLDGKSVHRLIDLGLMPGRRLPGNDVCRVVDRIAFLRWLCVPAHWIYFKTDRVGAMRARGKRGGMTDVYDFEFWEDAREIVAKARSTWNDEWLTPGQAAHLLGLRGRTRPLNVAIHLGAIKATRWGNWRILRSDLPAKGMTINAYGRIVHESAIGRKHCPVCRETGHNSRTCKAKQ